MNDPGVTTLFLTVGLPGAGKTTRARQLAKEHKALRLTPDEWMIPLFGEPEADGKRDVLEGRGPGCGVGHGPVRSRDHVAGTGKGLDGMTLGLVTCRLTVTPPEEVRPMNAVSMWVLPLPVTAGD
ncbi:AAA family ATPase [Streptosporangium canum]|uniref:AAA family ATPase n=1 Tax=Streptosporangium canum TaxID=324952 RepID=UPI001FED21D1|nr:AAA family ATPase [Streptosporangium canum]